MREGKREVAWAWCARHAQWGKARKWSFGCVSRGGMEQEIVCGQAVFLRAFPVTRLLRCMHASCSPEKHEKVAPALHDYSIV